MGCYSNFHNVGLLKNLPLQLAASRCGTGTSCSVRRILGLFSEAFLLRLVTVRCEAATEAASSSLCCACQQDSSHELIWDGRTLLALDSLCFLKSGSAPRDLHIQKFTLEGYGALAFPMNLRSRLQPVEVTYKGRACEDFYLKPHSLGWQAPIDSSGVWCGRRGGAVGEAADGALSEVEGRWPAALQWWSAGELRLGSLLGSTCPILLRQSGPTFLLSYFRVCLSQIWH